MYHNYHSTNSGEHGAKCCRKCRPLDTCLCAREMRAGETTMGAHVLVERSNARLTNATLRARRGVVVYSGTLSGMRARLYLNSMVAFSAALSAAPRWNEPARVGVSKGLEVRLAERGHCWRWLTCWRLDDGRLDWEVGALLRRDGGAPQPLPARASARRDRAPSGWLGCVHMCAVWAYRQSAWATRRGRAVGGGCRWRADFWCTFL